MIIINKKRFIMSLSILLLIIISILNFSFAETKTIVEDYTVSAGETLWSIALNHKAKNQDVRDYIYQLRKINNLDNCIIYPNQIIKIIK